MADDKTVDNRGYPKVERLFNAFYNLFDGPVTWFRETIVEPNRVSYPYYHRKFRRVPTIDECYEGDVACIYEAQEQFNRDRRVDQEIMAILRRRKQDCTFYEYPDHMEKCKRVYDDYDQAATNYFSRYGDLGFYGTVITAFMKQKHRMVWERRHGPIGSGMGNAADKNNNNNDNNHDGEN